MYIYNVTCMVCNVYVHLYSAFLVMCIFYNSVRKCRQKACSLRCPYGKKKTRKGCERCKCQWPSIGLYYLLSFERVATDSGRYCD